MNSHVAILTNSVARRDAFKFKGCIFGISRYFPTVMIVFLAYCGHTNDLQVL